MTKQIKIAQPFLISYATVVAVVVEADAVGKDPIRREGTRFWPDKLSLTEPN